MLTISSVLLCCCSGLSTLAGLWHLVSYWRFGFWWTLTQGILEVMAGIVFFMLVAVLVWQRILRW